MTPGDTAAGDPVVSGAMNFRDVGGLTADGGRTRSGILFRSGNLAHLDDDGRAAMAGLGIRRIIDLRDDDEVRYAPSLIDGLGIEVQRVPLFLGSVASFFERDVSLHELYRALLEESSAGVVDVVRGIVTDQPVLVHCTVGKDRTGVTVALTLAAAGVDLDAVVADYARTETLLPDQRNRDVVSRLRRMYPDSVNLESLATRSPAGAMSEALETVTSLYGSPTDYLRAHGLGDDEIVELRRILVEA